MPPKAPKVTVRVNPVPGTVWSKLFAYCDIAPLPSVPPVFVPETSVIDQKRSD